MKYGGDLSRSIKRKGMATQGAAEALSGSLKKSEKGYSEGRRRNSVLEWRQKAKRTEPLGEASRPQGLEFYCDLNQRPLVEFEQQAHIV